MPFTDDDLKRLKEDIAAVKPGGRWEGGHPWSIRSPELDALLARLEAAELALKVFRELESEKSSYDDAVSLYVAWRKACGK